MTVPESKLATIRNLLARAEEDSGATDAERELAAQRAAEMMARHAVDEAMVDAAAGRTDDPLEFASILIDRAYAKPKSILLAGISDPLNCKVIRTHDGAFVYGHRSDLERVEYLYTSLLVQAMSLVMRQRTYGTASQTRSFRGNWLLGFATRIHQRMLEGRQDAVNESSGAELVLKSRADKAAAKLAADHPQTRKSSPTRVTNEHGFGAGHEAGGSADLGHGRVGQGRRRAIGT